MKTAELKNKRVLVVGLGLTGWSVVRFLSRVGVDFDVADERASDAETRAALSSMAVTQEPVLHGEFAAELFSGFDVLILSPGVPRAHPAIVAAIAAGVDVIGDIELFAHAVQVPVIAVTGTNGKSTVVAWLAFALNECDVKAEACGNIGKPALDCLESEADVLVLELSSYQLESTRSLQPLSAMVLNVSDDHLDRYDDIEQYAAVKRCVYRNARNRVANFNDQRTWPTDVDDLSTTFITLDASHAVTETGKTLMDRSLLAGVQLSVPGEHNVCNALAVMALASCLFNAEDSAPAAPLAISQSCLLASLPHFHGLAHRSQFIGESGGVRWYNDSKGTNVDACEHAIKAMPGPVILIAGGLSKDADFTTLQPVVSQYVKLLVLIGRDKERIASVLDQCAFTVMANTLAEAVDMASDRAIAGDVVLLSPACASFDMFRDFEDRGNQFVAAVEEVLAA